MEPSDSVVDLSKARNDSENFAFDSQQAESY